MSQPSSLRFRALGTEQHISAWLRTWEPYRACHHCHQHAGLPCLNLNPHAPSMFRSRPHPGRPAAPEGLP